MSRPLIHPLALLLLGTLLLGVLMLAACVGAPRRPAPPKLIAQVVPPGFAPSVRFLGNDRDAYVADASRVLSGVRAAAADGPLNILALSGGGAGGAFGAGALVGMTQRGDRPQFQIVTGVSAGALIAPFAFLGPTWDSQLREAFGGRRADHLLHRRWLTFLFRPGLYQHQPLVALVDGFVTDQLLREIAAQRATGRLLLVATTDLDKEEPVIWDMGIIAAHGGESARTLFRDVLVASASIPGIFPPVIIHVEGNGRSYDEMHADGGTTLPFFIASEIAQVAPLTLEPLRGARVFILVNGQLNTYPTTTRERPLSVITRSFAAALMHASRRALELSSDFAERYAMSFRFTYIPISHDYAGGLQFQAMQPLFDYGAGCAARGALWSTMGEAIDEGQRDATALPRFDDACPVGQPADESRSVDGAMSDLGKRSISSAIVVATPAAQDREPRSVKAFHEAQPDRRECRQEPYCPSWCAPRIRETPVAGSPRGAHEHESRTLLTSHPSIPWSLMHQPEGSSLRASAASHESCDPPGTPGGAVDLR